MRILGINLTLIEKRLENVGWTHTELGRQVSGNPDFRANYRTKLENMSISLRTLIKIANALDIEPNQLFKVEGLRTKGGQQTQDFSCSNGNIVVNNDPKVLRAQLEMAMKMIESNADHIATLKEGLARWRAAYDNVLQEKMGRNSDGREEK